MALKKRNPVDKAAVQVVLKKAKRSPIPANLPPMLATLVTEPVQDKDWFYEMKWDGYRALAYLHNGAVNICSRNNKSFNQKYYPLVKRFADWTINAVLDGEIVVLNDAGVPDFGGLQLWRSEAYGHLLYYAFDILWLDGFSLMERPVEERRQVLKAILPPRDPVIRISASLANGGEAAFAEARALHLEGVMAKRKGSIYRPGERFRDWLKIKTEKRQELIIGGYTINEGTNKLFSSLLLGIMENGQFNFVTPVGTGFNRNMQEQILRDLKPYETTRSPFATEPE